MERDTRIVPRFAAGSMTAGVLLVILGLFAVSYFLVSTVAAVFMLGGMLIASGVFNFVSAFSAGKWTNAMIDILAGAFYVIAGVIAFRQPVVTASVITLVLAGMFMFQGAVRMVLAVGIRPPHWGWGVANGIITILLGIAVFATWPASVLWLLGTMIGIDMIISGWTMMLLGWEVRRVQRGAPGAPGAIPSPA